MAKLNNAQKLLQYLQRTTGLTIREIVASKKHGLAPHEIPDALEALRAANGRGFIRCDDTSDLIGKLRVLTDQASNWPSYSLAEAPEQIERVLRLIDAQPPIMEGAAVPLNTIEATITISETGMRPNALKVLAAG